MAQSVGRKDSYNIQMKDGYPFVFAGLWKGGNRLKPKTIRPRMDSNHDKVI